MQALGKSKMEHVLSIKPLSKELGVQGVGQGQQRVTESASVITGMTEDTGVEQLQFTYCPQLTTARIAWIKDFEKT